MATTKKITAKTTAPKQKAANKGASFFSEWKKDFLRRWHNNPSLYTIGTVVLVFVIATTLLFIYNKGLFLAGSINGKFITTPQFYSELTKARGEEVFDTMVREILIKQEAAKKDIAVDDKEIDKKIKEIEKRLGGKENFKMALKQNNTSLQDVKKQITIQLLAEKILADKIKVTDEQIDKYIKENGELVKGLSKEEVKNQLKSQKLNQEFPTWFDKLKNKANITTYF